MFQETVSYFVVAAVFRGCSVLSVRQMVLDLPFERERERAEEMALAVFHLDLPLCALALASHVLVDFFGNGHG